jgi:hypothetical protein
VNTQGTGREREDSGLLTGLFSDRESSEGAYKSLRDRGYSEDEINVMMSEDTRKSWYGDDYDNDAVDSELGSKAAEGATTGGAIGGTLGAVVGGALAAGSNFFVPGLGLLVWGPIAGALAGLGAGGATGGIVGALIGAGIPEDRAREYEAGINNGGAVLGVRPRSTEDADYFENDWSTNYRGQNIYR